MDPGARRVIPLTVTRLIKAVISQRADGVTVRRLAALTGKTTRRAVEVIRLAVKAGILEIHDHPLAGRLCVLTPLGASRAGVRLTDNSRWWVPADDPAPKVRIGYQEIKDEDGHVKAVVYPFDPEFFLRQPDRMPAPEARVIAVDEYSADKGDLPSLILGESCPLPPPKGDVYGDECPLHPGRLPRPGEGCLWCNGRKRGSKPPRRPRAVRLPR